MTRRLVILYDRLRWEEKALLNAARAAGLEAKMVDAKSRHLTVTNGLPGETLTEFNGVVLQRCISHFRGLYYTAVLESKGVRVINDFYSSLVSGNKILTSLRLVERGVPTPKTYLAFSEDSLLSLADELGYPLVLKPIVGSWGRMVAKISSRDQVLLVVEMRKLIPDPLQHIYYIQEYVERPPRDIRAIVVGGEIVAAIYRYQPPGEWRTNVAIGGRAEKAMLDKESKEVILKAAEAVGGDVLGVDAMESKDGLLVHEVNGTVEFRGASQVSGVDVAARIIDYVKRRMAR